MINRLFWLETDNTYPYRNLAMEEYMTNHVAEPAYGGDWQEPELLEGMQGEFP